MILTDNGFDDAAPVEQGLVEEQTGGRFMLRRTRVITVEQLLREVFTDVTFVGRRVALRLLTGLALAS